MLIFLVFQFRAVSIKNGEYFRGLVSKDWEVEINLRNQSATISNLQLPLFVDRLVYPGGFHPPPDPCEQYPQERFSFREIRKEYFESDFDLSVKRCSVYPQKVILHTSLQFVS